MCCIGKHFIYRWRNTFSGKRSLKPIYAFKNQFPFTLAASWGFIEGCFLPWNYCVTWTFLKIIPFAFLLCTSAHVATQLWGWLQILGQGKRGEGWSFSAYIFHFHTATVCNTLLRVYISQNYAFISQWIFWVGVLWQVIWLGFPLVWVCSFCVWKHLLKQWGGDTMCFTVVACLHCIAWIYSGASSRGTQGGNSV